MCDKLKRYFEEKIQQQDIYKEEYALQREQKQLFLNDIDRNMELKAFLNVSIRNLDSLREEMRKSINDLDAYMMGHYKL